MIIPISTIVIGVLVVSVLLLLIWLLLIERRLKKLLSGKNAQGLEGVIGALGADIRALESFRDEAKANFVSIEGRLRRSVQGVATVRFNAFKGNGEGGNQSFAVALLSEDGNGVVVSSIYARDRVGVFAKPIKNLSSEFEMTEEEKEVVRRATKNE